MKSQIIFGLFALLLLSGAVTPFAAFAESEATNVVINEIDLNPPGDDANTVSEWVELYNPTDEPIDISGWEVASTTILKQTLVIPQGTIIEAEDFLLFSHASLWFTDVSERVELRDQNGVVVDETPVITDVQSNFSSWQRKTDGLDTNSSSDWKFFTSNAGSSNGKLSEKSVSDKISVTLSSDKSEYLFDEIAVFSGSVSERVFVEKPTFKPDSINVHISGPNDYEKDITLFPDFFLNYKTTFALQKALGVVAGQYTISMEYAGASEVIQIFVDDEIVTRQQAERASLSISTNQPEYIPGQTATISAFTTELIPFEGLKMTVVDPDGKKIYSGTLFPTLTSDRASVRGGNLNADPLSQFSTTIFLNTINPVYGTYDVIAEYSTQVAGTTFELTKEVRDLRNVSVNVDRDAYALGETVTISGSVGKWIPTLDLEITQVLLNSYSNDGDDSVSARAFKVLDAVRIGGDYKFTYEFEIPLNDRQHGSYTVRVSDEIGEAETSFSVVENPDEYVGDTQPLSIAIDKDVYAIGDKLDISGVVKNPTKRSSFEYPVVNLSFTDESGKSLTIVGVDKKERVRADNPIIWDFTATTIPDSVGKYSFSTNVDRSIFVPGTYRVIAEYNELINSVTFDVVEKFDISETEIVASLDKDVYGLGETVTLDGRFVQQTVDSQGVEITLTTPSGNTERYGTNVVNGLFSWSWDAPPVANTGTGIKSTNDRSVISSNLGVYKIEINTGDKRTQLFFKVSSFPDTDSFADLPLVVESSSPLYKTGEKLIIQGTAKLREQGTQGLVVPDRVNVVVKTTTFPTKQIYDSAVYPDLGGNFQTTFVISPVIFPDGTYKIVASYGKERAENFFTVDSDFVIGGDAELGLVLELSQDEYNPGDNVVVHGKPNKIVYLDKVEASVIQESEQSITCGNFYCGHPGPVTIIRPDASGSFVYEYQIPKGSDAVGSYEITVESGFDKKSVAFTVVAAETPAPSVDVIEDASIVKTPPKKIIEKFNRISESVIPIVLEEKNIDDKSVKPRLIQGSVFTPARGEEANVNFQITLHDQCVIGQEDECLVKESTRAPGTIYQIVTVDDVNYKIRYSGPDVKLEKFTILPESSDALLDDNSWNVEIIKDDQPSRFYYSISYNPTE